jgi:site-specific DNA recombinase
MAELVSFSRVSTRNQALFGESLSHQAQRIEDYARQHGHTIIGRFSDEGLSGRSMNGREGIQQAVALTCRRRGRILCVSSLSRVARNVRDCLAIGDRLRRSGSHLVSLTESLNSADANGRLIWSLLACVHQWLAEVGAENTASVLQAMARKGLRTSGVIPYGFTLNPDGRTLSAEPAEQEVIGKILTWRQGGMSYPKIAAALEAEGIRTRSGRTVWMTKVIAAVYHRTVEHDTTRAA